MAKPQCPLCQGRMKATHKKPILFPLFAVTVILFCLGSFDVLRVSYAVVIWLSILFVYAIASNPAIWRCQSCKYALPRL